MKKPCKVCKTAPATCYDAVLGSVCKPCRAFSRYADAKLREAGISEYTLSPIRKP